MPAAVFWDMDGTIVDTEPYWMAAETQLIEEWGGTWSTEEGLQLVGTGLEVGARVFQSRGVGLEVDEIIATLTDRVLLQIEQAVPWRPGALELLREVRDAGIPTALVTMSVRRMAERVVGAVGFDAFDVIVSGDDVERAKPDPEPYLRAAMLLGVEPTDAVAIEDSEPGIASAVASGAAGIAVPMHVPLPTSPAYELWPSLEGRTLADLAEVLAAGRVA